MNIFHRLTVRALKKNRMRTIVTIIGIVLAMTLFTAVLEGAWSGLSFMRNVESGTSGEYHGVLQDVSSEKLTKIKKDQNIRTVKTISEVGYSLINPGNNNVPYLYIISYDRNNSVLPIRLVSGRLPRNSSELLIPDNMVNSTVETKFSTGDKVSLDVGSRSDGGKRLSFNDGITEKESLTDTVKKTYTIVGVCERPSSDVVPLSVPGFVAVTNGDKGDGYAEAVFTVRNPYRFRSIVNNDPLLRGAVSHDGLLKYYGDLGSDSALKGTLMGLVIILIVMIMAGTVSMIYNSFSISVGERTRQYGMLRSLGATKRQIRSSVYYEVFVLSIIGIPAGLLIGCGGIGITIYSLRDTFNMFSHNSGAAIHLVINPWIIISAIIICLFTTLVSVVKPARHAVSISPIDAIRQTDEINITRRGMKDGEKSWHSGHFYRAMAEKNFARNRKRSRTTVLSIFLSVVLFVSASSFVNAVDKETENNMQLDGKSDVTVSSYSGGNRFEKIWKRYSNSDDVTKTACSAVYYMAGYLFIDRDTITEKAKGSGYMSSGFISTNITFLDDATFRRLCRENGVSADEYMNPDKPMGLMYNSYRSTDSSGHSQIIPLFKKDAFPVTFTAANYYDEKSRKELADKPFTKEITVGAAIKSKLWFDDQNEKIYFPLSLMDAVYGVDVKKYSAENDSGADYEMYFMTTDHTGLSQDLSDEMVSAGITDAYVNDRVESELSTRMILFAIKVFTYGFIILISLIAVANVFNIISTGVILRKREFAMLRSVGMSRRGLKKMLSHESFMYAIKALAGGIPVAIVVSIIIWIVIKTNIEVAYYPPVVPIIIAIVVVFMVIFISMHFAEKRISTQNLLDALKDENV